MKMEKRHFEQRCAIKFCVKLNENTTETYENLKWAYGEHALSRARIFRWHKEFLDAHESFNNSEKGLIVSGRRLRTLGCCLTTTLPVTLPSPSPNFFTKKGIPVVPHPHTRLI
jgi:hypothetical protein